MTYWIIFVVLVYEYCDFFSPDLLENRNIEIISAGSQKTNLIKLPVAITVFPEDVYTSPESWARRAYPNLIYFREVDKGGHFAAWEQPQLFADEMRAAFKSLR